jgi:hypothetical protein
MERETISKNRVSPKNDRSRNIFGKALYSVMLAVAVVSFSSCENNSDPDEGNGNSKAVTFVSQIANSVSVPQTRATASNTWDGTEYVRVNVNGTTSKFFIAADGTLMPVSQMYWKDFSSGITASAWYPASGYSFPIDQSDGLQAADFIFADEVSGITYDNYTSKALVFKHKTAKVTVRLVSVDGITDLSGAIVHFSGYRYATIDTISTKTGAISGSGTAWIKANDSVALLIPRTYTSDESFIQITVVGNDYIYTPDDDFTLEAGKSYTFTITVNKASLILIQSTIADWDDAGNTNGIAEIIGSQPPIYSRDPVTNEPIWSRYQYDEHYNGYNKWTYRGEVQNYLPFDECMDLLLTNIMGWDAGSEPQQYLPNMGVTTERLSAPYPLYFTMDMGRAATYSELVYHFRQRSPTGSSDFPVEFEIWGSMNPPKEPSEIGDGSRLANLQYWTSWEKFAGANADGDVYINGQDTWKNDGWYLLGTFSYILPSGIRKATGWPTSELSAEDQAIIDAGYHYKFPVEAEYLPARYLRWVINEDSKDARKITILELEFNGVYAD